MDRRHGLTMLSILFLGFTLMSLFHVSPANTQSSSELATDMPVVYVDPQDLFVHSGEVFTTDVKIFNLTNNIYHADHAWNSGESLPQPGTDYNYSLGNLYGLDIRLSWDPTLLHYVNHTVKIPVETYPDGVLHEHVIPLKDEANVTAGTYGLAYASFPPAEPFNCPDANGTVFTITFDVLRNGVCKLYLDQVDLAADLNLNVEPQIPVMILEPKLEDTTVYVPVPFHYQINDYYCGPAALQMVFDYYGDNINQTEVAEAARTFPYETYNDELRRAAHFSNVSTSHGDEIFENLTGYSARNIGYAAFEQWNLTINDLRDSIDRGEPLIVLMWWSPSKTFGHYRVAVGYNETHMITHDPWNKEVFGGTMGGANTSMTYSTFLDLWKYIDNWGLLVKPWKIELQTPDSISEKTVFEVTAEITYPCHTPFSTDDYPATSCNAIITLPEGLELVAGETAQHALGSLSAGDSTQTSWSMSANETRLYEITVTATGAVEGSVDTHGTYPSYDYEDTIGGAQTESILVETDSHETEPFPTQIAVAILIISCAAAVFLVYFIKKKK